MPTKLTREAAALGMLYKLQHHVVETGMKNKGARAHGEGYIEAACAALTGKAHPWLPEIARPGTEPDIWSTEQVDAALSVWEAMLEARQTGGQDTLPMFDAWEAHGTSVMRLWAADIGKFAHEVWEALTEDQRGEVEPFDWEFCPRVVGLVGWSRHGYDLPTVAEAAAAVAPVAVVPPVAPVPGAVGPVATVPSVPSVSVLERILTCKKCSGTGRTRRGGKRCAQCHGRGVL